MLVTPKNGTLCLTLTLVTVATARIHLTNNALIVAIEANTRKIAVALVPPQLEMEKAFIR
jgi:hypothetical protein